MNKVAIAHETPLCLMPLMRHFTDYDYALVHLFEDKDKKFAKEYYRFFKRSLGRGRKVILDNSIFELGKSFDRERFFEWIYKLQPTEYIIPDVLENKDGTIFSAVEWMSLVHKKEEEGKILSSKCIGVLQGKTTEELLACYKAFMALGVEKIGISFDCSCYVEGCEKPEPRNYMAGRQAFMEKLSEAFQKGLLPKKPVHLLGCFLPQEFCYYKGRPRFSFIQSLDTSNPVVHGLKKTLYRGSGLSKKCPTKLVDFMKLPLKSITSGQMAAIFGNVQKFKNWAK